VRQGESAGDLAAGFTKQFGTEIQLTPYKVLKAAYDEVGAAEVEREANAYTSGALKVIEPSRKDIQDATRFYLAALKVMEQEKANALTIDCLGGFRRADLPAYPCVAFSRLNDSGYYGVCEADLSSTMTQMLITSFSGRPGFVSDPTFDTSRNEVIHAHCVAATRMMGLGGKASPYILRTHMEDEKGVSVQVRMPEREPVTVAEFRGPKTLLVSTGEATVNIDGPRGCRTKIVTKVADARKMAEGYTGGLHRVMFYGDLTAPLQRLARLTGIEIVKEI
jgi:L-fucose isomerase-like protein